MPTHTLQKCIHLCALTCYLTAAAKAAEFVQLAAPLSSLDEVSEVEGRLTAVQPPGGSPVLQVEGEASFRIDLKPSKIEPRNFDLLKIRVKADPRATLVVSLENYPEPGQLSHWYLFSKARDGFDWETAYIDLHRPEEIKAAGSYKGLAAEDPSLRGLRLKAYVADSGRRAQPPGRRMWLGAVRFVKKPVDLDWDQRQVETVWTKGGDLVSRYPLTLANRTQQPQTIRVQLQPQQQGQAVAELSQPEVKLAAGETQTLHATLRLPAKVARQKPPLFAERFLPVAKVDGIEDGDVLLLRSSDPLPLAITVPVPEKQLAFPLLPRRKELPDELTGFERRRKQAEELAAAVQPSDLEAAVGDAIESTRAGRRGKGFFPWGKNEAAVRFREGLTACAFLYDATGDKKYLHKGTALLTALADKFPEMQAKWDAEDVIQISHGVFATNTLRLGWATGSMRSPYVYQRHGMFNDFDLLAADMPVEARQHILDHFIVPAAIQMRNHCFGLGNQQDVVNYAILYAGLAARNWPLASFAYDSDYGLLNQIRWDFDDDGLAGEGHYHTPAVRPILYSTELLYHVGVDVYDQRMFLITHSPAADAIGKPFRDSIRDFVAARRFEGKKINRELGKKDGLHLQSGVTSLRWGPLEVAMNWGRQIHRGAPDRMSLGINAPESHPLSRIGGGNYSHSTLGQSVIIVDEGQQNAIPAEVTAYDIEGPVQFVQATSEKHFPGVTVTRTFALIGEHVLVLDRVAGDKPHTYDWCLRYPGGHQDERDVAQGVSLELEHRQGSFTDKPSDSAHGINFGARLKSDGYFVGRTDQPWQQAKGKLTMAAAPNTRVMVFAVNAAFSAAQKERQTGVPILMVRRESVRQSDFVAGISSQIKRVEQVQVTRPNGQPAAAIGAKVTLADGQSFRAIANFEPEGVEVQLGALKTKQRFATDAAVSATPPDGESKNRVRQR